MQLPKIIHFIWAGGEQLLPQRETKVIKSWAEKASSIDSNFKIYLWTDKETTPETSISKYKSEKGYFQENDNIEIHDIGIYREGYIAYELDRLRPNYGASSDMLRYRILYDHGGAYFDSDIRPSNEKNVLEIFKEEFTQDKILFISANSQNRNQPNSNTISVGNDNFITSAKNDIFFNFTKNVKRIMKIQI